MSDGEPREQLVRDGARVVEAARDAGVELRLLGGVAIALRCPSAGGGGPLARDYSDLDLATSRRHAKGTQRLLTELGYEPNQRFNAANGESRLLFLAPDGRHVDVFVDRFVLCHELSLQGRLTVDDRTLPLADLLLTKLQVAKLSHKDVTDMAALLRDHAPGEDDATISVPRLLELVAADWGWWRTTTETLERLDGLVGDLPLDEPARATVRERAAALHARFTDAPKSRRWRVRAKVGERRPWREDPDEVGA